MLSHTRALDPEKQKEIAQFHEKKFRPVNLPAAKSTGHRMVRVVVGGDYFEVMTFSSRSTLFLLKVKLHFCLPSLSPTLNFLRGGIRQN